MRIVVYAEGVAESSAGISLAPTPGERLAEHELGTAHVLIARLIERDTLVPQQAVAFLAPLRSRGRIAVGSDLHNRKSLRQLLMWPDSRRRPDFAVVLIDDDGKNRRSAMSGWFDGVSVEPVLAIAVQEFEAWLLADPAAVPGDAALPSNPEHLPPGEAKREIATRLAGFGTNGDAAILQRRVAIARTMDLERLGRLESFNTFQTELRATARRLGSGAG